MVEGGRASIVQFGTSRFLQAHVDQFIDESVKGGQAPQTILIVAGSGSASGQARMRAFGDPAGYPVIIRGIENGAPVERELRVNAIVGGLDAVADWSKVLQAVVDADYIVSNTTEKGYAVPEGEKIDLVHPDSIVPLSFPGRLLATLAARFNADKAGSVVFPTELISRNGDVLKGIVLDLAGKNGGSAALISWITDSCIFANSLVDRIVSEPIEPIGAIAEPYGLWAIEKQPGLTVPVTHPCIRVVDDLEPFARLKIHILNLGHTWLAEKWQSENWPKDTIVNQMLGDKATRADLMLLYSSEVLPGFAARGLAAEAAEYIEATVARFDNPFLKHRMSDIANGHVAKIENRVREFLRWTGVEAPKLQALADKYAN